MKAAAMAGIFETIRETASKAWNDIEGYFKTPDANGKKPIDRMLDAIGKKVELTKTVLSPESIKIALSYREISQQSISFKEILSLIKQSYSLTPGIRICILKTDSDPKSGNPFVCFDVLACTETNEMLFKPTCPWCHIVVASPDPELLQMFNEKSMLVLQ